MLETQCAENKRNSLEQIDNETIDFISSNTGSNIN